MAVKRKISLDVFGIAFDVISCAFGAAVLLLIFSKMPLSQEANLRIMLNFYGENFARNKMKHHDEMISLQ